MTFPLDWGLELNEQGSNTYTKCSFSIMRLKARFEKRSAISRQSIGVELVFLKPRFCFFRADMHLA